METLNTKQKRGRPKKMPEERDSVINGQQRVQILLHRTHPIEGSLLQAYNSGEYYPDGGDYIAGIDLVRRALVLGWNQLAARNPGAYNGLYSDKKEEIPREMHLLNSQIGVSSTSSSVRSLIKVSNDDDAFGSAPIT
jgi:hypothetical protein